MSMQRERKHNIFGEKEASIRKAGVNQKQGVVRAKLRELDSEGGIFIKN